jgi:hypothetical protein
MVGSSWVAAQLTASQERLSSMSEWVSEFLLRRPYYLKLYNVEDWQTAAREPLAIGSKR